jgi:hypothetical protein
MADGTQAAAKRLLDRWPGSILLAVACSAPLIWGLRWRTWVSDDLAQSVALTTWRPFGGSHFLVGADTFVLKWPFMVLANQVGMSRTVVAGLVGFFIAAMGVCFLRIGAAAEDRPSSRGWAGWLWMCSLPPFFLFGITDTAGRNVEITLGFLLAVWLGNAAVHHRTVRVVALLVALVVAIAALQVHDPYSLLFVPAALVPARRGGRRAIGIVIASIVGAAILAAVGRRCLGGMGVSIIRRPFRLTPRTELHSRVREAWRWIRAFGGFGDGEVAGWVGVVTKVTTVCMVVLIVATVVETLRRRKANDLLILGSLLSFETVGAFLLYRDANGAARYLTPLFVGLALMLASAGGRALRISIAAVALISVVTPLKTWTKTHADGNQLERDIQHEIEKRNLTVGYANYWHGQVVTYFTAGKIRALSVGCSDHVYLHDPIFTDDRQYERSAPRMFFLYRPKEMMPCTVGDVETQFGTPDETVDITDDAILLVYERDIRESLR